jgi:AraC-like DNA-binding protein
LQKALRLLTGPNCRDRRISDVALESGFSDLSHFNRLFRSRYGNTPSAIRAGGVIVEWADQFRNYFF